MQSALVVAIPADQVFAYDTRARDLMIRMESGQSFLSAGLVIGCVRYEGRITGYGHITARGADPSKIVVHRQLLQRMSQAMASIGLSGPLETEVALIDD